MRYLLSPATRNNFLTSSPCIQSSCCQLKNVINEFFKLRLPMKLLTRRALQGDIGTTLRKKLIKWCQILGVEGKNNYGTRTAEKIMVLYHVLCLCLLAAMRVYKENTVLLDKRFSTQYTDVNVTMGSPIYYIIKLAILDIPPLYSTVIIWMLPLDYIIICTCSLEF